MSSERPRAGELWLAARYHRSDYGNVNELAVVRITHVYHESEQANGVLASLPGQYLTLHYQNLITSIPNPRS